MLIPIPNIIVFQYNPETMTRTLTPWAPIEQRSLRRQGHADGRPERTSSAISSPSHSIPQETFASRSNWTRPTHSNTRRHTRSRRSREWRTASRRWRCLLSAGPGALGGLLNVSVSVSIGAGGHQRESRRSRRRRGPKRRCRSSSSSGDRVASCRFALRVSPSRNSSIRHCSIPSAPRSQSA